MVLVPFRAVPVRVYAESDLSATAENTARTLNDVSCSDFDILFTLKVLADPSPLFYVIYCAH